MNPQEKVPESNGKVFRKSPSRLAQFFNTEELWQELVDPSEADSAPEEVEDHDEWNDREDEKH